jgi:hypothetical protein
MSITCLVCTHQHPGHRYACDDCVNKLQKRLREIGPYWDMLDWCPSFHEPTRGGIERGAPGYASRSPANDDVIVALDPRSSGDIYGPDDVDEPTIGIAAGIHHLVTWVRELDPSPPAERGGLGYLLVRVPHVAMTKAITMMGQQIGRLHQQCRRLVHDQPAGPMAKCMTIGCEGLVYAEVKRDRPRRPSGARCANCARTYIGRDLWMLSVQQEAS